MFLDEASLAARIHHPNVAEILDLGEQDDVLYIVMEWVDGEALSVVTKTAKRNKTAVPMRIALRMLTQACAGLHAAHELRDDDEGEGPLELVHRDVSPQNILVTYDGVVKLVDFGVAEAAQRMSAETTAGQLKGKVPYMSPEQARGAKVNRRTDIFAMGIVLYKLTTGLHPFLGENDIVTMKNIVARPRSRRAQPGVSRRTRARAAQVPAQGPGQALRHHARARALPRARAVSPWARAGKPTTTWAASFVR